MSRSRRRVLGPDSTERNVLRYVVLARQITLTRWTSQAARFGDKSSRHSKFSLPVYIPRSGFLPSETHRLLGWRLLKAVSQRIDARCPGNSSTGYIVRIRVVLYGATTK